jgi:hypothetical protein
MDARTLLLDPLKMAKILWPEVNFYDKQRDVIYSVEENDETVVPAANMMGKDFVAGFICLRFLLKSVLLNRTCRVVTTSVKDDHLRVLWGEIGRFVRTARVPLDVRSGGPLQLHHRDIRKFQNGRLCDISYLRGMVSELGEGMAGHHADMTLFVGDEACHDAETEVLTDVGWKKFFDLSGQERFLTMNPATRLAEYRPATEVYTSRRCGLMYLYERRCGNFCVTPNHRMLWKRSRAGCEIPYSDYYLQPIAELNGTPRHIPRRFHWVGSSPEVFTLPELRGERKTWEAKPVSMRDWLEFLGWYFSEGNLGFAGGVPYSVSISQNDGDTLRHIANVAKRIGFNPTVCTGQSPCVRIGERRLAEYLLSHGRYCWEKRIPAFIGKLSSELIEVFLQAFKAGDGYDKSSGREIFYTSSPHMADELQILSFKAGREATVRKRVLTGLPAPNGMSRRDGFVVGRSAEGLDSHLKVKRQYLQQVDYSGEVYCVCVPPYHTIFTRRYGDCMWSGNSGLDDLVYTQADTWAKKKLIFGNCNQTTNFFYRMVKEGDLLAPH